MAINFPNSPVNGNTYSYGGVVYTFDDTSGAPGFWVSTGVDGISSASGAEVTTGTDPIKFVTPLAMEDSDYFNARNFLAAAAALINAGVDNLKFITSKGLKDSDYIKKDEAWPIGTIYENGAVSTNPSDNNLLGFGTWVRFGDGQTVMGLKASDPDFGTLGQTGGGKTHTLSVSNIAPHRHQLFVDQQRDTQLGGVTASNSVDRANTGQGNMNQYNLSSSTAAEPSVGRSAQVGSGTPVNHLSPYITVYRWIRTA